jgi:Zn-dependent peptidase ImmA (M78 family)/transcriptional regulator with XRE-family HTH domain
MIGQRLRLARASAGLSLRDLEDRVQKAVSAQAIGKYERDEMMPSSDVLSTIARELGVSELYLLGQGAVQLEGVEFRKSPITTKKDEAMVRALVMDRVGRYLEVEEVMGLPTTDWDRPRGAPYRITDYSSVDHAAFALRTDWGLGTDSIPRLAELLEGKGIKVLCLELPAPIEGLTCYARRADQRRVPVIVVNSTHTPERQRFTLAHEVAHMVLEVTPGLDEERVMQRFAGAFFMPAEVLRAEIGRSRSELPLGELFRLKPILGVSVQAIAYRCRDLEIISKKTMGQLFNTFQALGWRTPPYKEPYEISPETTTRFNRLCLRALAEGAVTHSKAAELLRITIAELNEQLNAPPSNAG